MASRCNLFTLAMIQCSQYVVNQSSSIGEFQIPAVFLLHPEGKMDGCHILTPYLYKNKLSTPSLLPCAYPSFL